jgi:RNA recognition motif-containing protein
MKSLFVGNLNFQTTQAELTVLFQPFRQVGRIHIVTDRETGRARVLKCEKSSGPGYAAA